MKKIAILFFATLLISSCGINRQLEMAKAFEDCEYNIVSTQDLYVANVNLSKLKNINDVNLASMPSLALAFLRKNIPLKGTINLEIKNPSSKDAGINQFEFKILIKGHEFATGFVNQKVSVAAGGGITVVPIPINTNIYALVSDSKTMKAIGDFVQASESVATEKKETITIKVRPTLDMLGKQLSYPSFITIDKEISSKILM